MVRNSFFQIWGDNLVGGETDFSRFWGIRADGEKQFFPDLGG